PDGSSSCARCGRSLFSGAAYQFSQTGEMGGGGQQQMFPQSATSAPQPTSAMPPATGLGSMRRAFAGHGTLIKHHSWLLDGQNMQVMGIRQTIFDKLVQRHLDKSDTSAENLTDQGLVDERRDYIRYRRKSTSVFIYATPAGNDLYISRATTVQPGFSLLRVIFFILLLAIVFVPFINVITTSSVAAASVSASARSFGAPAAPAPDGSAIGALFLWIFLLLFFSLPLVWVLVAALVRSIASLVLDGDFWVLLRPNSLTEFQRDEVALMEHTTDNVVREAMKQLGLDADKITAPPTGYQPAGRIRLI
ncbi:MAG TPA: hypothetical protein VFU49_10580, partial [Ktedonobacteraceae bacterium]|nr:hypothetical protein [Ktedonobacteraceae bacterium]